MRRGKRASAGWNWGPRCRGSRCTPQWGRPRRTGSTSRCRTAKCCHARTWSSRSNRTTERIGAAPARENDRTGWRGGLAWWWYASRPRATHAHGGHHRMDLIDSLLEYDRWATTTLLDVCRGLSDVQLDQPFDIGHQTLRATFVHNIATIEFWSGFMAGETEPLQDET